MKNRLIDKLEAFARLSDSDKQALNEAIGQVHQIEAKTDLISEGDEPSDVHLILDGFACRYKLTQDGQRQIMAYLVPGDFCDLHVFILKQMDHSIATLSPCAVVDIPRDRILALLERPAIARALAWATLVDEGVLREWLVGLGRRDASQRIAHLFCELLLRLRTVGLAEDENYELPITQAELADTVGLSDVHVNRSLQTLRQSGMITFESGHVRIVDASRLWQFSGFNPNYLHLERLRKR